VPKTLPRLAVLSRARNRVHSGPAVTPATSLGMGAPAVSHRLDTMHHGDQMTVPEGMEKLLSSPSTPGARFSKSRFPIRAVYGPIDHAGLRLMTCGDTYDAARQRYLDDAVSQWD
jgi:hypothetical protein